MGTRKIIAIRRIWLLNLNPDSDSIRRIQRIQFRLGFTSETGSAQQLHQHHQRKQTTMTSHSTTPTDPDRSICQWIRIQIHYETESRFGQIEYGPRLVSPACIVTYSMTWHVRLITTAKPQVYNENCWTGKLKTDMLRSIGKQSGKSVESVLEKKRRATVGRIRREGRF